jgi:beta-fructofuranosidase
MQKDNRDPHRPGYHFLPPANWMNDPNGLIHWKGEYHLFYQYNPNGAFWGTMHWGHAVSPDLVHWTHLPIALAPTPGSVDEDGCYSGYIVDHDGTPTLVYTGVRGLSELPCVAIGTDDLVSWRKYPGNPVIAAPPSGLSLEGFRDHAVWNESGSWYQLIGSGIKGVGGTALLYSSKNLLEWEYLQPVLVGDKDQSPPVGTGSMWECPDFFALGEKHVLAVSIMDDGRTYYPIYFSGTYRNHRFYPALQDRLDFGSSFYAPQSFTDSHGRRIMFGWLREGRGTEAQQEAGWSGVMCLPRELTLRPDGSLCMRPVSELEALRGKHLQWVDTSVEPGTPTVVEAIRGERLEIKLEWDLGKAMQFGVRVRCSSDHMECTSISYDRSRQRLMLDCSQSSLDPTVHRSVHEAPLTLADDELLRLQVFLDHSVIEVFANDRTCIAERIYPQQAESTGTELFAEGNAAQLKMMDIWELGKIE